MQREAKLSVGGAVSNIVHVSASHHTCSPLDMTFLWINTFPLFNKISVTGN